MARGHQKEQSQQKNAAKKDAAQKSGTQKDAQAAALKVKCPSCMMPMTNYHSLKQHFESKHPKLPVPAEEACK